MINLKKSYKKGRIRKFLLFGKNLFPLLLSHHPECVNFSEHTLNYGKYRFCIGCFIGYPTIFFTFLLVSILDLRFNIPIQHFFQFGLIFLLICVFSSLKLTKNKGIKILQKILIGIGLALIIIWFSKLSYLKSSQLLTTIIITFQIVILLNLYHVYGFIKTCYKCESYDNWGKCQGFERFKNILEKKSNT